MYLRCLLIVCFLMISSSLAAAKLPGCAKSLDIDGKGTRQYFNSAGWIFESWEFKDDYKFTAADSLKQLNEVLEARGSHLILVPTPFRSIEYAGDVKLSGSPESEFSAAKYTENWKNMIADVRKTGVSVIDLLPKIKSFKTSSRGEEFYYPRDHHWTTSGAELAAKEVAAQIEQLIKQEKIRIQRESNTISFSGKIELLGSFGEHYFSACGVKTPLMKRFDATVNQKNLSLFDSQKTQVGIFGDSFGQAYPDNNFAQLVENKTQLSTANYSVSGGGPTLPMIGYLADARVRAALPTFIVVPFQGWVSNNYYDYGQVAAALIGCDKKRMIDSVTTKVPSGLNTFTPKDNSGTTLQRIIHIHTSVPTNYLEVRGKYADDSDLKFEMYRTSADYFKGSRTDFYAVLPSLQAVKYITFKVDNNQNFMMSGELCSLK